MLVLLLYLFLSEEAILSLSPAVRSDQPQTYYRLLCLGQRCEPNLGNKHYVGQLKILDEELDEEQLALLAPPPPEPHPAPRPARPRPALMDADDGFEIAGRRPMLPKSAAKPKLGPKPAPKPAPKRAADALEDGKAVDSGKSSPSSGSSSSSSSSSSSDSDSDGSFEHGGGRSKVSKLTPMIGGAKFKVDEYKPKGKKSYKRFILRCTHHVTCERKRMVGKTGKHGRIEPLAFLAAWNELGAGVSSEVHRKRNFKVPAEKVDEWVVRLGTSLNSKLDKLLDS